MKRLATSGEILVEIMAERIGQSFLEPGPLAGPFPSGAPAIFIAQAAALGAAAGLIGAVGDDAFGQVNLDRLKRLGADVSAIAVHPGWPTGSAFVAYQADGSRQFVYNILHSAAGRIALTPEAERMLAEADHFHVMGTALFAEATAEVARAGIAAVKARGGTVSFDPNVRAETFHLPGMREALDFVLGQADVFLPSGEELFLFTRARGEASAAAELIARGVRAVVVKKGAAGAALYDMEGRTAVEGFAVEEVDPTGAGDCFGAAFVSRWLAGDPPDRALALANACGALAVTRRGPMEGIATLAEAEAFLARQSAGGVA